MINSPKPSKNNAIVVREIFLKYLKATRDFTVSAERCSIKVSPGQTIALQNAFRLQLLFNDRDALRFEYLLRGDALEILEMKSLYAMSDRLRQGWGGVEESDLRETNLNYVDVLRQIELLEGSLDSIALEEPLNAVKRDSDYQEARRVIAEKIQKFHKQLSIL
jgi:hypothetical protein